ncbi:hypothetical protein C1H46_014857 [Malus baccata]|uniref:Cytosolic Fe-S cluster assembly factor NBP35 n=1 Tax=Malus baccata TaxID=106549 RepID=A0A540ML91_MALBA|nr:hypothetical protein C1H46_014857 [Malus baccata]
MENGEIPEDANEHCPGPQSDSAGKSDACDGCPNQQICATAPKGPDPDVVAIAERMATVKHKILVLSGKGGVGKSTFSAQLAFALAAMDFQVGLLDIDICGPSIPKMLGLEGQEIHQSNLGWSPVYVEQNLGVMSIGFMLPDPDDAVIWRGPRKNALIKQFLKDVYWGELDFLIVDAPPGTSDEHISIVQYLDAGSIDGAIIVTTPQQVSMIDVRKEVSFCKKVGVQVLGVVENMSGLSQPVMDFKFLRMTETAEQIDVTEWAREQLKERLPEFSNIVAFTDVFDSSRGGAERMCGEMGVAFLGKVPLDPQLCKAAEEDVVAIAERMATVKHKILVLSGKGGVGKSTFSAQLAFALAAMDFQVGLLDIDICGPSIPKMLGLEGQEIHQSNLGWSPVYVEQNLGVMSIGFMLPDPDDAVIWRGPRKNALIKQFLKDVYWGELDFLIVDAPPGTSDEHISIVQYLDAGSIDGAIIVTTPQQVSMIDVRKEVSFCKKVGVQVLGVVENMSGLSQPVMDFKFLRMTETAEQIDVTEWAREQLKERLPEFSNIVAFTDVFDSSRGGAERMCGEMGVAFLGKVPLDPQLCKAAEEGRSCFVDQKCGVSAPALKKIIDKMLKNQGISAMLVDNDA